MEFGSQIKCTKTCKKIVNQPILNIILQTLHFFQTKSDNEA